MLLWLAGTASFSAAAERRVALVMGVWEYDAPGLANLPGIEADVKRFAERVTQLGFEVTIVKNPNIAEAKDAIDQFGERLKEANTIGLFYFSGHGGEFEGSNFLIPRKANLKSARDLETEAVSAKRLLKRMEDSGAPVNLVFLDCCRNTINTKAASGALASMQASGVFIGFATASEKEANASQDGSIYTNALLKYMGEPGLSITDMHTKVTGEVEKITAELGAKQTPFQYSGLNSLFYMTPGGAPPPPPLPPARPDPVEVPDTPRPPLEPIAKGPFIFPDSSERVLTRQELLGLDADTLWRARNEIYARNGYIFASERGRSLASALGNHYQGTTTDQIAVSNAFNDYERVNVQTIKQLEGGAGGGVAPPVRDRPPVPAAGPWLFADSSTRRITRAELSGLTKGQLWRARNEIYARRGYIFSKEEGKALARSLGAAYTPRTRSMETIEASFNAIEEANINLIKSLE